MTLFEEEDGTCSAIGGHDYSNLVALCCILFGVLSFVRCFFPSPWAGFPPLYGEGALTSLQVEDRAGPECEARLLPTNGWRQQDEAGTVPEGNDIRG